MTKLAQEAVDRLLEEHGGAEANVARGVVRAECTGEVGARRASR